MNKKEFLEILKTSLDGELPPYKVEQSIKYYDDYIGIINSGKRLDELGDPRLIGKTIIEAEKAGMDDSNDNKQAQANDLGSKYNSQAQQQNKGCFIFANMSQGSKILMYLKIFAVLMIVLIVFGFILKTIFLVSSVLLVLFIKLGLPIILVLLIIALFLRK